MKNNSFVKYGKYSNQVKLPKGVNQKEKEMFLAFAKSVNQSLAIGR